MNIMIARRLVLSLALAALVSNCLVLGRPSAGTGSVPEGSQAFTLVSLKHQTVGALTRVLIESNAPPLYTVFRPTDRLVVVELPGGDAAQLASEYAVKSALVDSIVVRKTSGGRSPAARSTTRIEITVQQEAQDRSVLEGNTLVIELSAELPTAKAAVQRPGVYVEPVPVSLKKAATAADRPHSQPAPLRNATMVRNVRSEAAENGLLVFVEADGNLQFKEFMLPDPWRIVVDITGVRTAFGNKTLQVGAAGIDRVRVGQQSNVVRIVLDAKSRVSYRVTREAGQLVIAVGDVTAAQAKASSAPQPNVAAQGPEGETSARQVDASTDSGDQSEIPADLIAQAGKPTLPAKSATRERTTATKQGAQPAANSANSAKETITQQAPPSTGKTVAELQRGTSSPSIPGGPTSLQVAPPPQASAKPQPGLSFCDDTYVGGLISFDLRAGVDLRDMLRFIAQQYGINFIIDKSVSAVPIDIKINDRPWNEILNAVLRANRLGALCEGDGGIIRIAALSAVKEQRELEKWAMEARIMVVPTETKIIRLRYARVGGSLGGTGTGRSGSNQNSGGQTTASYSGATGGMSTSGGAGIQGGGLLQIIGRRLSTRGVIEIDQRTNSLIITDIPEYIRAAEAIVAQLDKPDAQVEIEARIVIASRNFLRDLGVELGAGAINSHRGTAGLFATSPVTLGSGGVGTATTAGASTGLGPNLVGPKADGTLRGAANSVLSLTTGLVGTGILSTALSASETKGQVRTIASPRITASNNVTAEIVNGVQIPVQTVSNNTVTTTFVTAALRLEITPQIIEDTGEVLMHVTAENNTVNLAINPGGTPGINTQSADTTVRIMDGGTTVMGGINIDGESHSMNRTPGASKIPILGELFKRRTTSRNYDEILFFITPRIVRPDGWGGPKSLAPQRSSLEGIPSPTGTQKAAAPVNPNDPKAPKATQPVQAKAGQ